MRSVSDVHILFVHLWTAHIFCVITDGTMLYVNSYCLLLRLDYVYIFVSTSSTSCYVWRQLYHVVLCRKHGHLSMCPHFAVFQISHIIPAIYSHLTCPDMYRSRWARRRSDRLSRSFLVSPIRRCGQSPPGWIINWPVWPTHSVSPHRPSGLTLIYLALRCTLRTAVLSTVLSSVLLAHPAR